MKSFNSSSATKAKPFCGEIYGLWQHLAQRYDVLELTQVFHNFTHDIDFKVILTMGINILEKEINFLEKEMDNMAIPLPPRPPKSINNPTNTEILRDELMFRTIYSGIQNFVIQQTKSILIFQNEELKNKFIKMLQSEIDFYNKLTAYGNLKGWLHVPPYCEKRVLI
ncbi:MAG: DUF3231 family protein [Peptococcaceae bacterium]|jgi:hypothetical protein|nr:DUF3231 family protein [Peptococcaceae bacterium]MDH7523777.1 DUF3231 family protein [Peptococcaceae bacterium]